MSTIIKAEAPQNEAAIAGQETVQGKTKFQFLSVPASTVKGEILVKSFDGDNPVAVAAATATFRQVVVVATVDQGATAGFQWCVVEGECEALVDGTADVAKGDFLEVLNGDDGLTLDGAGRTARSVAVAEEAQATDADTLTSVYLIGEGNTIAAS